MRLFGGIATGYYYLSQEDLDLNAFRVIALKKILFFSLKY